MSRQDKPPQDTYDKSSSESIYPTREQFACVRCKNKKFSSWNDFENHHTKHAVDFTFSQLPFVKLKKIKVYSPNSKHLRPANHQDSETPSSSVIIESIYSADKAVTTSTVVPAVTNKIPTLCEPCESKLPEDEELLLTWPGSCESSSPLNSPIPLSTSSETTTFFNTATAGELQVDSNILDPVFIEKLGEEISFLNQTAVDSVIKDIMGNDQKDSLFEIQSVNKCGSSLSSISISDFPVSSLGDIPLAEPITSETPPAGKAITSDQLDKSEDHLPVINEKDVLDNINTIPDEAELPKSKGQLRLVPYKSLLSPSFLHADQEEKSQSNESPVSPSKTSNKPQAMVAIPEQNLEDINILVHTINSAPVKSVTQAVSAQQVLQKSQPTSPPEMTTQNMPQPTQVALMPSQQQRSTQVNNEYHNLIGQLVSGNCQPQAYQQQQQQQQQIMHQQQQQIMHQQQQQIMHQQQQQTQFQQQQQHQVMIVYPYVPLQYQQQIVAGQHQNLYAQQGQAHQNMFSNQPRMPSSNHIQHQLAGHSSYNHNHAAVSTNSSLPYYSNRPQTSTTHLQHVQLQIPLTQSNRPSVSTTQPNVRPQIISLPNQGFRLVPSSASTNTAPVQQPIQQRQEFVAIRPYIQPTSSLCPPRGLLPMSAQVTPNSQIVSLNVPTTSTTAVTISSVISNRLPTSSHRGQPAANSLNRPVIHKRPLVVAEGISGVGQPAHKIPRTDETTTFVSSNISATQQSGDCEVSIVQKKQTGLPVIQSVEGCSNLSTSKSSVQVLQTPSVASLLSNPNITVTTAKNKENKEGSDSASKATTAGDNGVIKTAPRPVTIDSKRTSSSLLRQRNPLQCQVCNETFNSQSLLKIHLVLHLRKVHPTAVRPTNNPTVGRNSGSKHAVTSVSSNFRGQTTDPVTPSTSGYVTTVHGSTTNQQHAQPSIIQPTETNIGSVNASQQTKNGAKSGQSRLANEINVTSVISTYSQAQSSSSKESSLTTTEKTASSNGEFYVPVVDLNRQDVITKLESLGITQFIPAANLTACSNNNNFVIPIMSSSALRRVGTTGFPSLYGVVNLGSPKTFASTDK